MKLQSVSIRSILVVGFLLMFSASVTFASSPVGTAFTYEGRLTDNGAPANGTYDFKFKLFDALSVGTQIGSTVQKDDVVVSNGLFTVELEFGASAFVGDARYLEILVRAGSSTGAYTTLSPRQELTPTPYALYARNNWGLTGNEGTNPPTSFLGTKDNMPLVLKTNASERMRIDANGNVGIGTLAPTSQLHVRDTANFIQGVFDGGNQSAGIALKGGRQWELQSVDPGTAIAPGAFILYDRTGSAYRMVVSSGGNVGIGTTNPLNKLDVAGNSDFMGNVGIGTSNPSAKLDVVANAASSGANTANFADAAIGPNMSHIHWGTTGDWYIRSAANGGKVILQDSGGNVGIGTTNPGDKLTVNGTMSANGTIKSTSGGFMFPDGSVQTKAAGDAYTSYCDICSVELPPNSQSPISVLHLDVPPGAYLIEVTARFVNDANLTAQNNLRGVNCFLAGEWHQFWLAGANGEFSSQPIVSIHTIKVYTQSTTGVDLSCNVSNSGTDRSYVRVSERRMTAVKLGNVTVQP